MSALDEFEAAEAESSKKLIADLQQALAAASVHAKQQSAELSSLRATANEQSEALAASTAVGAGAGVPSQSLAGLSKKQDQLMSIVGLVNSTLGPTRQHANVIRPKYGVSATSMVDFGITLAGEPTSGTPSGTDKAQRRLITVTNSGSQLVLLTAAFPLPADDAFELADEAGLTTGENVVSLAPGDSFVIRVSWLPRPDTTGVDQQFILLAAEVEM